VNISLGASPTLSGLIAFTSIPKTRCAVHFQLAIHNRESTVSGFGINTLIKQINRRVKGGEKFWRDGDDEAMLQLRAAQLSQDDHWNTC